MEKRVIKCEFAPERGRERSRSRERCTNPECERKLKAADEGAELHYAESKYQHGKRKQLKTKYDELRKENAVLRQRVYELSKPIDITAIYVETDGGPSNGGNRVCLRRVYNLSIPTAEIPQLANLLVR